MCQFNMFDDQTTNPVGGAPKNLPVEPDDIFAGVDMPAPAPAVSNALDAGILKKVEPVRPSAPMAPAPRPALFIPAPMPAVATPQPIVPVVGSTNNQPVGNVPPATHPDISMKETLLCKINLVVVLCAVLGGL